MVQASRTRNQEGRPLICSGLVNGPLAITRHLIDGKTGTFSKTRWNITHVRSGYTLFSSYKLSKRKAMRVVELLLPLLDWSQRQPELLAHVEANALQSRISETIRQVA
jgi:hypothetical protein